MAQSLCLVIEYVSSIDIEGVPEYISDKEKELAVRTYSDAIDRW